MSHLWIDSLLIRCATFSSYIGLQFLRNYHKTKMTKRIQKVFKIFKSICKKLRLKRKCDLAKEQIAKCHSPNILKLATPQRSPKFKDPCFLYGNVRFTRNAEDGNRQSLVYRGELDELRSKIESLQAEKSILSRALQTNNDSFTMLEDTSSLDPTPPPPMSPLLTMRRDSAYYSFHDESKWKTIPLQSL